MKSKVEVPELPNGLKLKQVWYGGDLKYYVIASSGKTIAQFVWDGLSTTYESMKSFIRV